MSSIQAAPRLSPSRSPAWSKRARNHSSTSTPLKHTRRRIRLMILLRPSSRAPSSCRPSRAAAGRLPCPNLITATADRPRPPIGHNTTAPTHGESVSDLQSRPSRQQESNDMSDRVKATVAAIRVSYRESVETAVPPREVVKTVSEPIVSRLVAMLDAAAILGTGILSIEWSISSIDWRLLGLVVLLGTVLGINFLHLAGAYRFARFSHIDSSVGRVLTGWLATLAILFAATRPIEPVIATDRPWIAIWFLGGLSLLVAIRIALHQQIRRWAGQGRLDQIVAIVGAGPIAQRLLRSLRASRSTNLRIVGVYDDATHLPQRCMGHPILGTVEDLVHDVR